ncbi:FAD-dependent oxidoreductase [Rhizobium leguminosarum]|nr:FAD-dependent oxidoreductase [Rhizobium leguminosarum]
MAMTNKILIVGAGPTGLTAALELARRGIAVDIIDRDNGPTPLSKAVGISSHSLDVLEPSGVTPRLLADGIKVTRGHAWYEDRKLATIDFSILPHRFNFLLSLPQSETETTMIHVLSTMGTHVKRRTALVALRQAGDRVDVSLDGPEGRVEANYDYVFGADGVDSTVRKAVGLSFDGYTHSRIWSIADAEIVDWPYERDVAQLFLHAGGDLGFAIPIGDKRFRVVSNTHDALARIPGRHRVLRTDTFHIPVRQAPRYQDGRVFLGGDAAHVHSPVGARGMNLGIEDAACFASRLARSGLDGYTGERSPIGARWMKLSERILAVAQCTGPGVVTMRNLAFRVLGNLSSLQRPLVERVAGLQE